MSLTRRLAAGLPAVGVTALAALAFAGAPASAATGDAGRAVQPAVMTTPCATDARTKCTDGAGGDGYGNGGNDDEIPNDNGTSAGGDDTDGSTDDNGGEPDDDRGNPGYGGESPTPSPSVTTPTGGTDTVPPGGVSPTTSAPGTPGNPGTPGGGVSAGGTLPVTGAPMAATLTVGAVLVAGGAAAVWYTRRRRVA
jgi:LPXTG-motif cell wall-anchored protein